MNKYILPAANHATEYDLPYGQSDRNGRKFKTTDGKFYQLGKEIGVATTEGQGRYSIKPVTEKAYKTRKGYMTIQDLNDPNAGSWNDYRQNAGRVIHVEEIDEYFLVESLTCLLYDYGWKTTATGRWLLPAEALPLKAAWDHAEKERNATRMAKTQAAEEWR